MDLSRFANASPSDRLKLAKLFQRAAILSRPPRRRLFDEVTAADDDEMKKEPNR
jgi:hypothetical protein